MREGPGSASGGEAAWWLAALAGDGEAFASIFDLHQNRVYRHASRLVDCRSDAEDVTAAAFLELWRRRDAVRLVEGSVLPWLLVTTGNVARNLRRSTRRYRALLDRLPREDVVAGPAEILLDQHPMAWDAALMAQLRSMGRVDLSLVTLVALEGLSIAEASQVLGISVAAAKSRLHRIRNRPGLRTLLRPVIPERSSP